MNSSAAEQALPPLWRLYLAALVKRGQGDLASLEGTSLAVPPFHVQPAQLARYSQLFGDTSPQALPAPLLYWLSQPAILRLLTLPGFPLRPAGLVHLGVAFDQTRPITQDDRLTLTLNAAEPMLCRKGLRFTVQCRFDVDEQAALIIRNSYLARQVASKSQDPLPDLADFLPAQDLQPDHSTPLNLTPRDGRAYARLSGDYNPIHLSAVSARLFGFKRAIIHGMYQVCAAYQALAEQGCLAPPHAVFQFRSPLYLPGQANLALQQLPGSIQVNVTSAEKVHMQGEVQAVRQMD